MLIASVRRKLRVLRVLVVWYERHGGSLSELNWEFEVLRGWCTTQLVKEKGQSTSSTNEALP